MAHMALCLLLVSEEERACTPNAGNVASRSARSAAGMRRSLARLADSNRKRPGPRYARCTRPPVARARECASVSAVQCERGAQWRNMEGRCAATNQPGLKRRHRDGSRQRRTNGKRRTRR